jgi:uncharacterized protein YjbI with pentapeptide repeats
MAEEIEGESFADEDWYGEDLVQRVYRRCSFTNVDLTEAQSRLCTFDECRFGSVRFNASRHHDSAFLSCTFRRCNFFEARFDGCKLSGSQFVECDLRPLEVTGGDWSFVGLSMAKLRGVTFRGVRMREADLGGADLTEATLSDVDLSGAQLAKAVLVKADLRGSDLSSLDPAQTRIRGARITLEQAVAIAHALGLQVG